MQWKLKIFIEYQQDSFIYLTKILKHFDHFWTYLKFELKITYPTILFFH